MNEYARKNEKESEVEVEKLATHNQDKEYCVIIYNWSDAGHIESNVTTKHSPKFFFLLHVMRLRCVHTS